MSSSGDMALTSLRTDGSQKNPLELLVILELVEISFLTEKISLVGFVLEDDVSFRISAEFPWFNQDNVARPDPELSFKTPGYPAVPCLPVEAFYLSAGPAKPLLEDANHFVVAR